MSSALKYGKLGRGGGAPERQQGSIRSLALSNIKHLPGCVYTVSNIPPAAQVFDLLQIRRSKD